MASVAVFAEAGKQNVSSLETWLALETVYYLLQFGLAGVAAALAYRSGNSGPPAAGSGTKASPEGAHA